MYNNQFKVIDYVNCTVADNQDNIEHSQTIMSLLTDLPCYEIKSPQKKMFHRRPCTDFLKTLQVVYLSAETYQMAIVLID